MVCEAGARGGKGGGTIPGDNTPRPIPGRDAAWTQQVCLGVVPPAQLLDDPKLDHGCTHQHCQPEGRTGFGAYSSNTPSESLEDLCEAAGPEN